MGSSSVKAGDGAIETYSSWSKDEGICPVKDGGGLSAMSMLSHTVEDHRLFGKAWELSRLKIAGMVRYLFADGPGDY